jgi:DNA-binding transcriptional ArsR family regulator
MTTDTLDPQIHAPARLRIVATLAALPGGDALCLTRLQDMTGLTPGNLITHLRKLGDAGYVQTEKTGSGASALTTVALTHDGRSALDRYTAVLRRLRAGVAREDHRPPRPDVRIGDADRDAAAAALGEHFAQGRLTLDELDARLDAIFTATTHRELSRATCDLPDVTVPGALPSFTSSRRDRARRGHRPSPAASQGTLPRPRGRTRDWSS